MLRELAGVLSERLEARERAFSPAYLEAYRTPAGTLVGTIGGLLIFGCYLLMLRLGRVPEPRRTAGER